MTIVLAVVLTAAGFALGRRSARLSRSDTTTVYAVRTGRDPYYVAVHLFRDRDEAEQFRDAQIPAQSHRGDGEPLLETYRLRPAGAADRIEAGQ